MSPIAGQQRGSRVARDDYPTAPAWTDVLLRRVELPFNVWEPAAGDGAMAERIELAGHNVFRTDIATHGDFLLQNFWSPAAAIVTNPPFSLVDEFIEQGLLLAEQWLCLLLGWHFVAGGQARAASIWQKKPPTLVLVIPERMVVHNKASQFNHAWVCWKLPRRGRTTRLEWHSAFPQGREEWK